MTRVLRLSGLLLCATLMMAQMGPGFGPGPGMPPPPGDPAAAPAFTELKTFLSLTDDQVAKLKAIQTARFEALKPIAEQLRAKNRELRALLKAGNADAAAIGKLTQDIAALRKQMETVSAGFATQAAAVLTAVQTAKLAELKKALELMPAARQAVGLQLIEPPDRDGDGVRDAGPLGAQRLGRMGRFGFRR